jgi:hypothetical protein
MPHFTLLPFVSMLPRARVATGLAVLAAAVLAGCGGGEDAPVVATPPPEPPISVAPSCAKTNAKVNQVAVLSTLAHAVSGRAKVLDDCTIEITNFNYDGGGLATVYAYGAIGGRFTSGFAIGPNLRGTVYTNQTLTLKLKAGDLDKLDSLSIWCEDAKADFGSGRFVAP